MTNKETAALVERLRKQAAKDGLMVRLVRYCFEYARSQRLNACGSWDDVFQAQHDADDTKGHAADLQAAASALDRLAGMETALRGLLVAFGFNAWAVPADSELGRALATARRALEGDKA
jgi:hypothetical protein